MSHFKKPYFRQTGIHRLIGALLFGLLIFAIATVWVLRLDDGNEISPLSTVDFEQSTAGQITPVYARTPDTETGVSGALASSGTEAAAAWREYFAEAKILLEESLLMSTEGIERRVHLYETEAKQRVFVVETNSPANEENSIEVMRADQMLLTKPPTMEWGDVEASLTATPARSLKVLPGGLSALLEIETVETLEEFETVQGELATAAPDVRIDRDYARFSTLMVDDPLASSHGSWGQPYADQWGLGASRIPEAWDHAVPGDPIIVAVIDTGIDENHVELAGQLWSNAAEIPANGIDDDGNGYIDDSRGWNFQSNTAHDLKDIHGHGTAMSGVIGARQNNGYGIAGIVDDVAIMSLKNGNGLSFASDNIEAVAYAVANGARVINMSFSGTGFVQAEADAVKAAFAAGVVLVGSAGNSGLEETRYPSSHPEVISVGASTPFGEVAYFSTHNALLDVVAPGFDILTLASRWAVPRESVGFQFMRGSGTSPAAAHVSGIVALIRQARPTWTPDEVITALRTQAKALSANAIRQGYGQVDALASIRRELPYELEITTPHAGEVVNGQLAIYGTAAAEDFVGYSLKIRTGGLDATGVATDFKVSNQPVEAGLLGTLDTSAYTDGLHVLELELQLDSGEKLRTRYLIDVGNSYGTPLAGWPKNVFSLPGAGTAADVDGNGIADFIGTGGYCDIGIVDGNGTPLPGWNVKRFYPAHNAITNASVGDIDGDGDQEVVFETRYQNVTTHNSGFKLHAYTHDGKIVPGWPKSLFKGTDLESSTNLTSGSVLADLDLDGMLDILTVGADQELGGKALVHAFKGDGSPLPGWPVSLGTGTLGSNSSVAVADVDGDGLMEVGVIVGNGQVFLLESDGTVKAGWPVRLGPSVNQGGTVSFADFDHDASMEVLAGTYSGHIAVYETTGALVPGWPKQMPSQMLSPAIADFDEDGDLEIVTNAVNTAVGGARTLYLWHHDGKIATGWPVSDSNFSPPIILDFDGDSQLDIVASSFHYTRAFRFDGSQIQTLGLPRSGGKANHSVAADFTGDGTLDLVATESTVPFAIAILNYATRPITPQYMPWPQPGIDGRKNRALVQAKFAALRRPLLQLVRESRLVTLYGDRLIRGHRVKVNGTVCEVVEERPDRLVFELPVGLHTGHFDLEIHHANYAGYTFQSGIIVVNELSEFEGANLSDIWAARYQPEVFEAGEVEGNRLPTGDLDNDGFPNLLEFALRAQGFRADRLDSGTTPPVRREGGHWVFDYQFDPGLGWVAMPQISTNLTDWYSVGDPQIPFELVVEDLGEGDDPGVRRFQARIPFGSATFVSFRLKFDR